MGGGCDTWGVPRACHPQVDPGERGGAVILARRRRSEARERPDDTVAAGDRTTTLTGNFTEEDAGERALPPTVGTGTRG